MKQLTLLLLLLSNMAFAQYKYKCNRIAVHQPPPWTINDTVPGDVTIVIDERTRCITLTNHVSGLSTEFIDVEITTGPYPQKLHSKNSDGEVVVWQYNEKLPAIIAAGMGTVTTYFISNK